MLPRGVGKQRGDKTRASHACFIAHAVVLSRKKTGDDSSRGCRLLSDRLRGLVIIFDVPAPEPLLSTMAGNPKCAACSKTVYMMERIDADGKAFHKPCLKCSACKVLLCGRMDS